jgi:hypothetical protein
MLDMADRSALAQIYMACEHSMLPASSGSTGGGNDTLVAAREQGAWKDEEELTGIAKGPQVRGPAGYVALGIDCLNNGTGLPAELTKLTGLQVAPEAASVTLGAGLKLERSAEESG